jgi:hypothetical protein
MRLEGLEPPRLPAGVYGARPGIRTPNILILNQTTLPIGLAGLVFPHILTCICFSLGMTIWTNYSNIFKFVIIPVTVNMI